MERQFLNVDSDDHYSKLPSLDLYYIPQNIRGNIRLGRGYDLTDPWYPVVADESPFLIHREAILNNDVIPLGNDSNEYTLVYEDRIDERTVAQFFHADLRLKGLSYNIETSMSYVHNKYDVSQGIRFVLENKSTRIETQDISTSWDNPPITERDDSATNASKWKLFKGKYGSHYITSFSYGYRIEILAFANTKIENSNLKLHAAFGSWFGKGRLDAEISENIQQSGANINIAIFCEKISNKDTGSQVPFIITGISAVMTFLQELNDGKIIITAAPTTVSFKSYASSICGYFPKSCQLFDEVEEITKISAIPKGSIISWNPPASHIVSSGSNSIIKAPSGGWAICDKRNHNLDDRIPDLSDRFLFGTSDPAKIEEYGGSFDGGHTITMGLPEAIGDDYHWLAGDRRLSIQGVNIPPYMRVVYIIKI